jgi:hypothetical protein
MQRYDLRLRSCLRTLVNMGPGLFGIPMRLHPEYDRYPKRKLNDLNLLIYWTFERGKVSDSWHLRFH